MKNNFNILTLIILAGGFITSCQDDYCPDKEASGITFSENVVDVLSKGRYYSITVNALDSVTVSCTADWIELENATLDKNGQMVFYIMKNEDEKSREATIQVTTVGVPAATAELTITQHGTKDDGGNDVAAGELSKDFRVGWGYNICMDFMSDKSVTQPILDYHKLLAIEKKYDDRIVDESNRSKEEIDTYTASSLTEMARKLTSIQDTESSFLGLAKTVTRHVKITNTNTHEAQVYGYARIMKIIATRHIDEGKLDELVRTGADIFTADFLAQRNLVQKNPTPQNVNTLLDRFGTHLVVLADIGGAIDYSINFKASKVTDLEKTVTSRVQYVIGKKTSDQETKKEAEAQSSVINSDFAITIMGGDHSIVNQLKSSINQLNANSQLDSKILSTWMSSLDVDYREPEGCKNLTVVKCKTLPLWTLFTNEEACRLLKEKIIERANNASISWDLKDLGISEAWEIPVSNEMISFASSRTTTLVRMAYINKEPRVEICNEYMPGIRNDRRVTVLYPLQFGVSNIRRGIFPGDGQGNQPAYITNTPEGKAYIRPIEGYGPTDQLQRIYYLGGNLYPEPNGIKTKRAFITLSDVKLTLYGEREISYPIVKIGCGYWTRTYLQNKMGFGKKIQYDCPQCGYYYYEKLINKVLYANYFYENDPYYVNRSKFGVHDGLWYLPTGHDLDNLMTTIGNNPKALFIGQVSGFDADFMGYYGKYDIRSNTPLKAYQMIDDQYSFIGFKNDSENGNVLVIGTDYGLGNVSVKAAKENYYPIRLFRNQNFVYPNK